MPDMSQIYLMVFNEAIQFIGITIGGVASAIAIVLTIQFANNASRNMSQTNANVSEEISKISKQ